MTRAEANGICAAIFRGLVQATVLEGFGSIQSEAVTRVGRIRGLEEVAGGSTETAVSTRQDFRRPISRRGQDDSPRRTRSSLSRSPRRELNARDAPGTPRRRVFSGTFRSEIASVYYVTAVRPRGKEVVARTRRESSAASSIHPVATRNGEEKGENI